VVEREVVTAVTDVAVACGRRARGHRRRPADPATGQAPPSDPERHERFYLRSRQDPVEQGVL